jgi:hypothetical protein
VFIFVGWFETAVLGPMCGKACGSAVHSAVHTQTSGKKSGAAWDFASNKKGSRSLRRLPE